MLQINNEEYNKISLLGNMELRIYLHLKMYGNCKLSIQGIAGICKVSRQAMYKAIDKLSFNGLIDVNKVDNKYLLECKESLQVSTEEAPETTIIDKAIKEFPQLEGMNERDIANKLGNMVIRKQADKYKYKELLESNGWSMLFS